MQDGSVPWPFEQWEESVSLERFLAQLETDPTLQEATGIGAPPARASVAGTSSAWSNASMSNASSVTAKDTSSERGYHRGRVPSTMSRKGRRAKSPKEISPRQGTWCHTEQPASTDMASVHQLRMTPSTNRQPEDNPTSPPKQRVALAEQTDAATVVYHNGLTVADETSQREAVAAQRQDEATVSSQATPSPTPPPPPPPSSGQLSLVPAVDSGEVQRGAMLLELKRSATGWGSQAHDELVPAAVLRESAGAGIVTPTDRELKQAAAGLRNIPAAAPKAKKAPPPSPRMRGGGQSGQVAASSPTPPPPPPPSSGQLSRVPQAVSARVDSGEVQRGAMLLELKRSATGWGSQAHDELVPAAVLRESAGAGIVTPNDRELKQAAAGLRNTPAAAPKAKKAPPPSPRRRRAAPPLSSLPGPSMADASSGKPGPRAGLVRAGSASPPPFPDGRVARVVKQA